jgi:hypothetical protein
MRAGFNVRSVLLQDLQRDEQEYAEGEQLSLVIHSGEGGGWGWSNAGDLPPAGHQQVNRHNYNYSRLYGRIEIAGSHVEGAKRGYAAERRPYDFETTNLLKQMRSGFNFELYGTGDGLLGTVAGATTATTFTLDHTRGVATGQVVDILLKANGATGGGCITAKISVARSTSTIRITYPTGKQLIDWADLQANPTNYGVYRQGSYDQSVMGLGGIISADNPSAGNLGGIDRTAAGNEFWHGNVFANSGVARRPELSLIEEARAEVEQYSDGAINLILCGYNVFAILMDELVQSKRFQGTATTLNGWATAMKFEDQIPIVRDRHCPPDKMYLLDTSTFTLYQNNDGQWMNQDGAILSRVLNRHAYEAAWFRFCQLVCHAPNANAVVSDLDYAIPIAA